MFIRFCTLCMVPLSIFNSPCWTSHFLQLLFFFFFFWSAGLPSLFVFSYFFWTTILLISLVYLVNLVSISYLFILFFFLKDNDTQILFYFRYKKSRKLTFISICSKASEYFDSRGRTYSFLGLCRDKDYYFYYKQ